ncbi:cyclophilin-like domain-containing protein [Lentinula raphanica]|uniref:peptidylprolyl isomerase n=1 Tax=Lentinula raphanica TaxID=153919 RepID=A0AA38P9B4_9AGAR|nr:cyclophilin-like domain-containing protein [Lentinula raphanica]KAJ3818984.1 cyclophilin-like domain-containing protein [Lentinula raphanica]KAJ3838685.1 cyclophilin-like domain-containing protein [Lentinula raphanica]KAJ3966475.1 cyclophilin-like domain-containing protein [Lentinula raphanica]
MVRPRVFMDFSVGGEHIGRVIFELYNDSAPKTTENFRALCTGEKGRNTSGVPLYYKNSIIHRSIKGFMIQGGDFTKRNGTGGESIYGGMFADEDLTLPLDSEALLCMANRGPNTNGSQFFITLRPCPHLNGKHVVFGRVLKGYDEVVKKIADVPVNEKDTPLSAVVIHNCGELELRKPPAKPAPSESESDSAEEEEKSRKSRRRSRRSRSDHPSSDDDSDAGERRRRKKSKRKHKRDNKKDEIKDSEKGEPSNPRGETEEEYDARLEREEKERLAATRKRELQRIKEEYEAGTSTVDGVRFKGRGRMKYVDPDVRYKF